MADKTKEQIAKDMAQLRELVQSHAGDKSTLDMDTLKGAIQGMVDAQIKEKWEQHERTRPFRRGELIGPPGFQVPSQGVVETGKFAGQRVEDVLFANWLLEKCYRQEPSKVRPPSKDMQDIVQKALTATGVATGDEYVPTGMAAQLWTDFFLQSRVVPTIGTVPMPTDPFDFPLGWGSVTWRKGTQNTATTVSDPATAKSVMTSTEQVAEVNWAYDLDEDAVIAVLPTLREELSRSGGEAIDNFTMNADSTDAGTGNINLDDANPPDDSYYLSLGQDGIRHLYIVDNTAQSADINAALTDALWRAGIAKLGKYGVDPTRLVAFADPETYLNNILALTNVVTVDKYGPQATVLTGELLKYQGIPVVPTSSILEAEDDGKQSTTAANNDEGQIAMLHRDMWKVGFRRQLLIEVDKNIQKRQFIMVVSFRIALAARGTRSSAVHTAGVHGIVRN